MSERIPSGPLEELAIITMGQSPESAAINEDEHGLPFLQGCAEFGSRFPTARVYCSPPLRIAGTGSTLISVRAPVGTTNRADQDYCIGRGLGAVLARPGLADDTFLLNAIQHGIEHLHRRSQGSTFLAIGSSDLRKMPIPVHGIKVQQRIADILSTLDDAIAQTEALIAKTQQIKAGLMNDLFTRGVMPDGRLRPPREEAPELYKESPIGWIPREWTGGSLSEFLQCSPKNGYSPVETPEWKGMYSLGLGCLTAEGFQPTQLKHAPPDAAGCRDVLLRDGDFLISRSNTRELVGLAGIFGDVGAPCIYPDLMMRLKPNSRLATKYLELLLLSPLMRLQIAAAAVGTSGSMVKLNARSVMRLQLSSPERAEQERIVSLARRQSEHFANLKAEREKLECLKRGLMHDLLTGRVRVPMEDTRKASSGGA